MQDEKNDLFRGPYVRLATLPGMVRIEIAQLANEYAETVRPVLKRRYGQGSNVEVLEMQAGAVKVGTDRTQRHSEIARKGLATGNLSPNKTV